MRVVVYTVVYNGEATLATAIESVLAQTYPNFEYYIENNGSTDGTHEIIQKYAERDCRIKVRTREKNHLLTGEQPPQFSFFKSLASEQDGYVTSLDADDWLEPDFLERMLSFAKKNNLDIACTGTEMHCADTEQRLYRKTDVAVCIDEKQFAEFLPFYHVFFRAVWNKLISLRILNIELLPEAKKIVYGADTIYCFALLRQAKRIGVDTSVLHHYLLHSESISYKYDAYRFDSDVYLYDDALDFLRPYGPVSRQNRWFLDCVYALAVVDTLRVLDGSSLSPTEKIREIRRIAEHRCTQIAYQQEVEVVRHSKAELRQLLLKEGSKLSGADNVDDLEAAARVAFSGCQPIVTTGYMALIWCCPSVLAAVVEDDANKLLEALMYHIEEKLYAKQFDFGALLDQLLPDGHLLKGETDTRYYRTYAESCRLILKNSFGEALEQMTGVLLESDKLYAEERFLKHYLSIAALENQIPAFLYGNVRLAYLYFNEGHYDECRSIVNDLEEMGAGEQDEVLELRRALENVQ